MVWSAARSGPSPAAQARASTTRDTASSMRTVAQMNPRSHVPIVDAARVAVNTLRAAPARSTATSSIESPPASIAPMMVSALIPALARPAASAGSFTRWSISSATPSFCASAAGATSPPLGTTWSSSKVVSTRARLCDDRICEMPS
jgi:hypothetical protein